MITRRCPRTVAMTNITFGRCRNMISFLACGNHPVMTRGTAASHFVMIDSGDWRPGIFAMTAFTGGAGADVTRTAPRSRCAVMTGKTCG